MAEKLMKYYKYASDEVGLQGRMKLAQLTKTPSTKAAIDPDSPETIQKFMDAIAEITGKPAPNY
jgi:hypothetical protein